MYKQFWFLVKIVEKVYVNEIFFQVRGEMQADNEEQAEHRAGWHFNYDKICVSDSQMMPQAPDDLLSVGAGKR